MAMSGLPVDPGAQLAQLASMLSKGNKEAALLALSDALVRTAGMSEEPPGAPLAMMASLIAKANVSDALFSLADAMVRIANGTTDPLLVVESMREILEVAKAGIQETPEHKARHAKQAANDAVIAESKSEKPT